MEIYQTGTYEIKCVLDIEFLEKYGLSMEIFEKHKSFKDDIVIDLLTMANEKYGIGFDVQKAEPNFIYTLYDRVVMIFRKSNIIYLEGEEYEELEILKGLRSIFTELPFEKVNMGIIDVEEKQRILDEIRNDDDMKWLREYYYNAWYWED